MSSKHFYLAAPGVSCYMQTPSCGMGYLVPWPGIDPKSPDWERRVSVTGPPGKPPNCPLEYCVSSDGDFLSTSTMLSLGAACKKCGLWHRQWETEGVRSWGQQSNCSPHRCGPPITVFRLHPSHLKDSEYQTNFSLTEIIHTHRSNS